MSKKDCRLSCAAGRCRMKSQLRLAPLVILPAKPLCFVAQRHRTCMFESPKKGKHFKPIAPRARVLPSLLASMPKASATLKSKIKCRKGRRVSGGGKIGLQRDDISFDHLPHTFTAGLTVHAGCLPVVYMLFAWGGADGHPTIANISPTLLGGSARPSLF
jgi:hypothetical protein